MENFKYRIILIILFCVIGILINIIIVDKWEENYTPVQAPTPPQQIEVITYDTLNTDNAHVSVVTIDSAKYVVVKYGKSVAIAPHRR